MRMQNPHPAFHSTSDETRNSQAIDKGIVELVTTCKELSYDVQIGPDCPGSS